MPMMCENCSQLQAELDRAVFCAGEAVKKIRVAKKLLAFAERKAQPCAQALITEALRLLDDAEGRLKDGDGKAGPDDAFYEG